MMEYVILEMCLIVLGCALARSFADDTIHLPFALDHNNVCLQITVNKRTKRVKYELMD